MEILAAKEDPPRPGLPASAGEVAARLAQRLCHDFMSPASGIVSGLDLLADPSAAPLRDEAMDLIASSARKLIEALVFARAAFGGVGERQGAAELESLCRGLFSHLRPTLDWAIESPELSPIAARTLLNLVQLAAGAVATGGAVRVSSRAEPPWTAILVDAIGERARLHAEVAAGLRGEGFGEGLSGRWVQAYCVHDLLAGAGGVVAAEALEGRIAFKAAAPD